MKINMKAREISLKLVYYGPGMSGKTTNLVQLHSRYPTGRRGDLIQLDTETERTLFFDYFPVEVGKIGGFDVKFDIFTVPGQSFYKATRFAVLKGVDAVAFVADSGRRREDANLLSKRDLVTALESQGRTLHDVPVVYQWNKRDLPKAQPVNRMEKLINTEGFESFEAIAKDGVGVWETQLALVRLSLDALRQRYGKKERMGA